MLSISWKFFLLISLFLTLSACFGGRVDVEGSTLKYRNGIVTTEGGAFGVGRLPPEWDRRRFPFRSVLFVHRRVGASIGVSSFCKGSADDAPLSVLSQQLRYGITEQKMMRRENIPLAGREALRVVTRGRVDGAEVILDTVVLKMNECTFDFSYTAVPQDYRDAVADFEKFFGGFQFIKGPE